jgi:hypothetical protein
MTRLTRCFLTLLFFFTASAQASNLSKLLTKEWFRYGPDCLDDVLGFIHKKNLIPSEQLKLEGAAYYNDQIFKKFSDLPVESWNDEIEKTINHFAAYDGKFHAPSYKKWLKENPAEINPKSTVGEYLNKQNEAFLKKHPEGKIQELVAEMPDELRTIANACEKDVNCHKTKIGALISTKFNNTCISKFKSEALKSMITSLALTNAGYGISTASHPEDGYPYDLMMTNLIWTPIMAELGCRNTLEKGGIGKKVDLGQRVTFSADNLKSKMNNYISYMILSPVSNATYVAFHTSKQLIKGEKKWEDISMWDLTKQVGSLTVYDAIYPVPRMVFITDPLYMKGIPAWGKYLNKKLPKAPATGATYFTDWGSRIGLSFVNTELVNVWVKKSDDWWDTKFTGGEKKEDQSKPLNNSEPQ